MSDEMKPEELTVEKLVEVSGPTETWEGQCYAMACIAAELIGNGAVAVYGHYLGDVNVDGYWGSKGSSMGFVQHGWVLLPDGRVLDPTRWSFENVEPYIYLGEADAYDEGGNAFRDMLNAFRVKPKWRWDPKDITAKPVSLTTVTSKTDPVYATIARILGPDEVRFGSHLVITAEQLFYVANTHYDQLAPVQHEIYRSFAAAGRAECVPLDNRRRAEREFQSQTG